MRLHELKIKAEYANAKLKGIKPFEIRLNDRNYQVGDIIRYTCIDSPYVNDKLKDKLYHIVYITDYMQLKDYIVFCDLEVESENKIFDNSYKEKEK